MSNIVAFAGANLPSVTTLSTALRNLESDVGPAGVVILKMDKTGAWVYGADQTEVEDGSKWAVNPFSFVHGFIAWGEGEVLGEKMVPVSQPLPDVGAAPPGAKKGWEVQVGCALKCINGEDAGLEVRYSATSVGGKKAIQSLAVAIATQVDKDQSKPVPVVELMKEHYQHKQYGKIFTPLMKVVEWVGMNGNAEEATLEDLPEIAADKDAEDTPAVEEGQRRRRRQAV